MFVNSIHAGLFEVIFQRTGRGRQNQPELYFPLSDLYILNHVQGNQVLLEIRIDHVFESLEYIFFCDFFHKYGLFI